MVQFELFMNADGPQPIKCRDIEESISSMLYVYKVTHINDTSQLI